MKNLSIVFALFFGMFLAVNTAEAQQQRQNTNVGQALSGLINVSVGAVALQIETGDITLVDVDNVLNDAEIRILNNVLNNSPIASNNSDILTNLLREANIITGNQVVVGVLGGALLIN